jgi:hypothetical protein
VVILKNSTYHNAFYILKINQVDKNTFLIVALDGPPHLPPHGEGSEGDFGGRVRMGWETITKNVFVKTFFYNTPKKLVCN